MYSSFIACLFSHFDNCLNSPERRAFSTLCMKSAILPDTLHTSLLTVQSLKFDQYFWNEMAFSSLFLISNNFRLTNSTGICCNFWFVFSFHYLCFRSFTVTVMFTVGFYLLVFYHTHDSFHSIHTELYLNCNYVSQWRAQNRENANNAREGVRVSVRVRTGVRDEEIKIDG